jgi:UDP-N-acetylmuramyl pentapeptide synthase
MLELGPLEEQAHRELGRRVAAAGIDGLVGVGPASELVVAEAVASGLPPDRAAHAVSHDAAAAAMAGWARPGDTVLVKGSRGIALEQVIQLLVKRWQG